MTATIHEAAAELAAEYATLWAKDCGRFGDAKDHIEIRVWDGRNIVVRALTGAANGWHRVQRFRDRTLDHRGYPILAVFSVRGEDFVAACKALKGANR